MRTNRIKCLIGAAHIGVLVAAGSALGATGKVYIADEEANTNTYANTVSVIDVAERKVIATVPVGKGPNGISITP